MSEAEAVAAQKASTTIPAHEMEIVECDRCKKAFVGASVVTETPSFSTTWGQYTAIRKLYCDHCDCLMLWEQVTDADGTRFGRVISSTPTYIFDKKIIDRHLRDHPHARGVLQSESLPIR